MDRRTFVNLLAGLCLFEPLVVRAQQAGKIFRIGLLVPETEPTSTVRGELEELRAGLRELGWVEGKNIIIETRWAGSNPLRQRELAAQLKAVPVALILALGTTSIASARDGARGLPVVMINASFAKKYYGDQLPVGTTMRLGDSTYAEVVGVVADIKDQTLIGAARRRYYVSYLQHPIGTASMVRMLVRTQGDPSALIVPVRKAITELDANLPIRAVDPLARLMRESLTEERLLATLATVFGLTALLLAAVGLYGVMSYAVSRRAGEIGLRVALGAQRGAVIRMVLRDAMLLVGIGVLVGVPLTFGAGRVIRSQLHGVEPTDPVTFVVALGILALGALTAAVLL